MNFLSRGNFGVNRAPPGPDPEEYSLTLEKGSTYLKPP